MRMKQFSKNLLALAIIAIIAAVIWAIETARCDRHIRPKQVARGCLVVAILVGLVLIVTLHFARAADYGQWDRSDPIVKWYQELMQPDNPAVSCCGEADAYWADSYEVQGNQYIAIITDTRPDGPLKRKHRDVGSRFLVPNHKLKYDQSNPTGHGIIFLSNNDFVYCYVAPGGV